MTTWMGCKCHCAGHLLALPLILTGDRVQDKLLGTEKGHRESGWRGGGIFRGTWAEGQSGVLPGRCWSGGTGCDIQAGVGMGTLTLTLGGWDWRPCGEVNPAYRLLPTFSPSLRT